ncbi:MAG: hypothetical protein IPL55_23925 [Saprospiraceae bacterium]|jgi:hypothetical protein|nr:hypothetical protein [Saprospiraceae bacterium]MBL0026797.1 hypothetical protein [Saprospiraceae bacterium]
MFTKLKNKWKVSWFQFLLIFTTFALGGSVCARLGNLLLNTILTEDSIWYWIIYVPLVTLLWPFCVIAISVPFGQFKFFAKYLKNIGIKMGFIKKDA